MKETIRYKRTRGRRSEHQIPLPVAYPEAARSDKESCNIVSVGKRRRTRGRRSEHQIPLPVAYPEAARSDKESCNIVSVGKRRDGGTRYWCLAHRADATAKYGLRAEACRLADVPMITDRETVELRFEEFPGGVALWGAVAPVYDTTLRTLDHGIHIHTRTRSDGQKNMDTTVRAVRLFGGALPAAGLTVSEHDAIYHMVSSVFGYETKYLACTFCEYPHLDRDWFSVHPHRRHLCAGCGRYFRDGEVAVGNPIQVARVACGFQERTAEPAGRAIEICQSDYPGGLQIWGSNQAFLWTSSRPEEEGIHLHLHAFLRDSDATPTIDETYSEVVIDGIVLDPTVVRLWMAQSALPHLHGRILSGSCSSCGAAKFCNTSANWL